MSATTKRKYYNGLITVGLNGFSDLNHYSHWRAFKIYDKEFVSFDGNRKLLIKRDNVLYDLSQFEFDKIELLQQPEKERDWQNNTDKLVIIKIYGGLKKKNFIFTDTLKYISKSGHGFQFESTINKCKHYVGASHFDKYFVQKMINGIVTGNFTYAKHGSVVCLTLVT